MILGWRDRRKRRRRRRNEIGGPGRSGRKGKRLEFGSGGGVVTDLRVWGEGGALAGWEWCEGVGEWRLLQSLLMER